MRSVLQNGYSGPRPFEQNSKRLSNFPTPIGSFVQDQDETSQFTQANTQSMGHAGMTICSYAQNLEDVMLWRALKNVPRGFYIDIGAWSPDQDSVTRLFYDAGWSGINIEPNREFLTKLREKRPRDINLGLVVSDTMGEAEFYVIEDTGLSTVNKDIMLLAVERGFRPRISEMEKTTLSAIWDHVPLGQEVHFLKIDVEGHEEHVIRGADWSKNRPWIVLVEAMEPGGKVLSHYSWEPILLDASYEFVWFDGLNRFYVAKEHHELASAFTAAPNVFDGYRRAEEVALQLRAEQAEERLAAQRAESVALQLRAEQTDKRLEEQTRSISILLSSFRRIEDDISDNKAETADLRVLLKAQTIVLDNIRSISEWAQKPYLYRVLFRRSGKPRKALWRLLFHSNGKPRKMFRSLVLRPDGRPHSWFRQWMASPEYQGLRLAVRVGAANVASRDPTNQPQRLGDLSVRARAIYADFRATIEAIQATPRRS